MRIALRAAALLAVAAALFTMPAHAWADHERPGLAPDKPSPVRPATTSGTQAKPPRTSEMVTTSSWSVSLSATSTYLWPTQYTTLTATANQDVGPTPYYIRIFDSSAYTYIATCGSGTTCSATVTKSTVMLDGFTARVELIGGPSVATSLSRDVYWHGAQLALSASPTTLAVGGTTTVTATTALDVGPSPLYIEIFDATNGTLLRQCGVGTSCSTQVSQSGATTHAYQAFLSKSSATFPPAGLIETSSTSFVTWSNNGWHLFLSQPPVSYNSPVTVTATSTVDVGPTPYYIQIFNENGTRLAVCGSGVTCSVTFWPTQTKTYLVAFVSSYSTSLPPAMAQASSNVVVATYYVIA